MFAFILILGAIVVAGGIGFGISFKSKKKNYSGFSPSDDIVADQDSKRYYG